MLLKHRQDRFGGEGNLYVHVVTHSVRILTDGSGKTASTPKIVSDVTRTSARGYWPKWTVYALAYVDGEEEAAN
jgi:hypothetical protein